MLFSGSVPMQFMSTDAHVIYIFSLRLCSPAHRPYCDVMDSTARPRQAEPFFRRRDAFWLGQRCMPVGRPAASIVLGLIGGPFSTGPQPKNRNGQFCGQRTGPRLCSWPDVRRPGPRVPAHRSSDERRDRGVRTTPVLRARSDDGSTLCGVGYAPGPAAARWASAGAARRRLMVSCTQAHGPPARPGCAFVYCAAGRGIGRRSVTGERLSIGSGSAGLSLSWARGHRGGALTEASSAC